MLMGTEPLSVMMRRSYRKTIAMGVHQWYNITTICRIRRGYNVVKIPTYTKVAKGELYGKWLIIADPFPQTHPKTHSIQWFVPCRCECGTFRAVRTAMLRNGHSPSCGVCNRPRRGMKHGEAQRDGKKSHLYSVWAAMKQRCLNPKSTGYAAYGGRGITVCEEWQEAFESFRDWAYANGYDEVLQLDRIDNNKGYSPENCQWTSVAQQKRNMRQTVMLTAFGETKCQEDWAMDARCTVTPSTIRHRIEKLGWTVEKAITEPRRAWKAAKHYQGRVR